MRNVLSLFNGCSGSHIGLDGAGVEFNNCYSSEIDKYAIMIADKNYPQDIPYKLGDITKWREWNIDWNIIDLVIGGSPCQGFSIAGKKLNFSDSRSKLFFTYVEILEHVKKVNPNVKFLLENVRMPKNISDKIDEILQVKHVYLNSKDFTGMIRKRYYWFNWELLPYKEKNIKLKDIIDNTILYDREMSFLLDRTIYAPTVSRDGIITINPKKNNNKQTWQRGRVYDIEGSCPTICASLFDLNITKDHKTYRKLVRSEWEKMQGLPNGYTKGVPVGQSGKMLGNGWNNATIIHILKSLK